MTDLRLPAEDRTISPYTGWTREHWAAIADHLLVSLRPYFSASGSRVSLPGRVSANGADSDGFEGFARSLLLYAFRLTGERGNDPLDFTSWYRRGLLAGTDPANPERWPSPREANQAKVEAASIALALELTRPWLWDTLSPAEQGRVTAWLAAAPEGWYPDNNWLWFRLTVEAFLASVGAQHDDDLVAHDLATIESYYRADGWYADGPLRAYDYYCGWAMHVYPLLWTRSPGSQAFGSRALEPVFRARLQDFLEDYAALIGSDGMPVLQGRSLVYRFATAAPLWMGAVTGATTLSPGLTRRAASGILRAFVDRGALTDDGLLTLGLFGEWPAMAQSYSGAGSPYWASKGMLGLMLPADHAVWTAVEQPLPVERGDVRRVIRPAGWIVSGTVADGLVRVYNHGADHALPGASAGDSPLYARYGYSSATIPPLTGDTVDSPVDNSVGGVDVLGRSTHRTGFAAGAIGDDGGTAFATSLTHAHWVDTGSDTSPDHGSGRDGDVTNGPRLSTASLVRGAWEVRAVLRLPDDAMASEATRIRISGWPVAGHGAARSGASGDTVRVDADGLVSELVAVRGHARASVHEEVGTSPLGENVTVPWLEFDEVAVGDLVIAATCLRRAEGTRAPRTRVVTSETATIVEVTWPDDVIGCVTLPS